MLVVLLFELDEAGDNVDRIGWIGIDIDDIAWMISLDVNVISKYPNGTAVSLLLFILHCNADDDDDDNSSFMSSLVVLLCLSRF